MPPASHQDTAGKRRPWVMIAFLGAVALYLLYAVVISALELARLGAPPEKLTVYLPALLIALVCAAASIGLYRGQRWAAGFGKWARGGAGALVDENTPTWISVALLLLVWAANALGSAVLWALSIGNVYVGYSFVATNLIGIAVSAWLFMRGRRALAIKGVVWVIPLTLLGWFALAGVSAYLEAR